MTIPMIEKTGLLAIANLLDRQVGRSSTDHALRETGLSRKLLQGEPGYLPLSLEAVILECAARRTGERHLGALVGAQHSYSDLGWYAKHVLAAPSLLGALNRGLRALPVISPGVKVSFRISGSHIVLLYDFNLSTLNGVRHLEEGMPFLLAHLVRHFAGRDWSPDWVELPGRGDHRSGVLEEQYKAPVHFGTNCVGIAFAQKLLACRNLRATSASSDISYSDLRKLIGTAPPKSMSDMVLALLPVQLQIGDTSAEAIASRLCLGKRTLERRLQVEGESFRSLKQRFLRDRAIALLKTGDWGIDEVATALGYSEPNNFRRAFRTWTNYSPTKYLSVIDVN